MTQTRIISKVKARPGATYLGDGKCRFLLWAPLARQVDLHLVSPDDRFVSLKRIDKGYFEAVVENVSPGTLYMYQLDGQNEYPDPTSCYQPQGVLGPSQVVDPDFQWDDDNWFGVPLAEYIIYELHVGTFTDEGTFEAIINHLDELKDLGITAIELMPLAQFPGNRNWGYDGVYPFAVQNSYGGIEGLKRLVNAAHIRELAVILDVVYNHIGPEGNYLPQFGPYFTDKYKTSWGKAINFDDSGSDEVRYFFIENALYWITEFHIDALRLDAVHAILDFSPQTFLEELAVAVKIRSEQLNRRKYLIAESDTNDARLVFPRYLGGYGMDAQWNDDFHHALHVLLTGEQMGYYQDYNHLNHLVKAIKEGFAYTGEYSQYRGFRRGSSSRDIPSYRLVVFSQNHDHVGNRMLGERLNHLVSFESLKLAAGVVLLSPCLPLIFMGEEYAEDARFHYFVSHSDPKLVEAVRQGRKSEFADFQDQGDPPDPQSESTFWSSKLNHQTKAKGMHRTLRSYYHELIQLRKTIPALNDLNKDHLEVLGNKKQNLLYIRRLADDSEVIIGFNFGSCRSSTILPVTEGRWEKRLDSSEKRWGGQGSSTPETLDSDGELELTLGSKSLILLSQVNTG